MDKLRAARASSPGPQRKITKDSYIPAEVLEKAKSASSKAFDIDSLIKKLQDASDSQTKDELSEIKKIIAIYRKIEVLKPLPKPMKIKIPDDISREDFVKYATECPHYINTYEKINSSDELIPLGCIIDAQKQMFAFLYNVHKYYSDSNDDHETFYTFCDEKVDSTLIELRELSKKSGRSLESYFNEFSF